MKTAWYGKYLPDRLLNGACLGLLIASMFSSLQLIAAPADYINVGNLRNLNVGTWTGTGSLSRSRTFCIASADDNGRTPGGGASTMPYQVRADDRSGPGVDFYLYLNDDTSATGNRRIRATVHHRDILDGNSWEQLTHGVYDSHAHNGQFRDCRANGSNAQVRADISAADMVGKVNGRYRGFFTLTGRGGSSGTATDSDNFNIIVRIQASPMVQISRLDAIGLGTHSGIGNIYSEENFCIYSTSTSGSYNLSVSSANQDGGGNFFLDGVGGIGQIPYDLHFIDSGTGPGTQKVGNGTLSGFGNSSSQDCNGVDNASVSVSIQETDLQRARSGSYRDTLVLLVSPQ